MVQKIDKKKKKKTNGTLHNPRAGEQINCSHTSIFMDFKYDDVGQNEFETNGPCTIYSSLSFCCIQLDNQEQNYCHDISYNKNFQKAPQIICQSVPLIINMYMQYNIIYIYII